MTVVGWVLLVLLLAGIALVLLLARLSPDVRAQEAHPIPQTECADRIAAGHWDAQMWTGPLAYCAELWPYDDRPAAAPVLLTVTPGPSPTP